MSFETRMVALIQQDQSATLEFNQAFDKATIETVCSFANAKGGRILIGVRDDANVVGVSVSEETAQENTVEQTLDLLKENPRLRHKELVSRLSRADSSIKQHLQMLKIPVPNSTCWES